MIGSDKLTLGNLSKRRSNSGGICRRLLVKVFCEMADPPQLSPENNWKEVNRNPWMFQLAFLSERL